MKGLANLSTVYLGFFRPPARLATKLNPFASIQ